MQVGQAKGRLYERGGVRIAMLTNRHCALQPCASTSELVNTTHVLFEIYLAAISAIFSHQTSQSIHSSPGVFISV